MQKTDFHFDLPEKLIAQYPTEERTASRLLYLNRESNVIQDKKFTDIVSLLEPDDLLVMNNTRVIAARLYGKKQTGGTVEILIERVLSENRALAFIRSSKSPRINSKLFFKNDVCAEVIGRHEDLFEIRFIGHKPLMSILDELGEIPLPPYMTRNPEREDQERYQTVFAKHQGAVAAPTAGLHFDEAILEKIESSGIETGFVTLHVGAGTFKPIRVDNILEHKMHHERVEVSPDICEKIIQTKAKGGRVVAVGTTVVRSLESAALSGSLKPFNEETNIFIYPGFRFNVVDALITNFHLSESTLLMLVCAFADKSQVMTAYSHAVNQEYRFFSYGDVMFID